MTPRASRMAATIQRVDYLMELARAANYAPVRHLLTFLSRSELYDVIVILSSDLVMSGYDPRYDSVDTHALIDDDDTQEAIA